jgi:hypothetical protein
LTRELTLQEIGEELAVAGRELTWMQRKDVVAALLENLRCWKIREEKLKTKNVFEASGNSPTHSHGLESVRRRIMEAFEKIRQQTPSPPPTLEPKVETYYTEHQRRRFHARAESLIEAASACSHSKSPRRRRLGNLDAYRERRRTDRGSLEELE